MSSVPSLFLCFFGRDTAQSALFDLFSLHELAPLSTCCHACYSWLDRNGALERRYRDVTPTSVWNVRGWVRRHIGRLNLKLTDADDSNSRLLACNTNNDARKQLRMRLQHEMQTVLVELGPQFLQLRQLELHIAFPAIDADVVERAFQSLPLLRILSLRFQGSEGVDVVLSVILRFLGLLTALVTFSVYGVVASPERLDFAPCLGLAMLKQLNLPAVGEAYVATDEQLSVFSRLPALVGLNVGQYTERSLPLLLSGKTGRVDGVVALSDLALNRTLLTPAMFDQLCALRPTLLGLWPHRWAAMSAAKFAQLGSFASLTKLSICPDIASEDVEEISYEHHLHPALLGCPRLTNLQLGAGLAISEAQLAELIAGLPALSFLVFYFSHLGGLAPLSQAAALTRLTLIGCVDLSGVPPSWRALLPSLPSCTELTLQDEWYSRLTEEQAKPLNEDLMRRMPKLIPAKFTQNLKRDPM